MPEPGKSPVGLLIGAIAAVGAAIGIGMCWLLIRKPQPLYQFGQTICVGNGDYEIIEEFEWRESTQWTEGDGQLYEPQWWYYAGTGWWPESYLEQFN